MSYRKEVSTQHSQRREPCTRCKERARSTKRNSNLLSNNKVITIPVNFQEPPLTNSLKGISITPIHLYPWLLILKELNKIQAAVHHPPRYSLVPGVPTVSLSSRKTARVTLRTAPPH